MYTDPRRVRADIPGRVEGNPVFQYHRAFNPDIVEVEELESRYRRGTIGDVEVKARLIEALEGLLAPLRVRRAELEREAGLVEKVLSAGTECARQAAHVTMGEVHAAMGRYRLPED